MKKIIAFVSTLMLCSISHASVWYFVRYINQSNGNVHDGIFSRTSGTEVELAVLTYTPITGGNGNDAFRLSILGISTDNTTDIIGKVKLTKPEPTSIITNPITVGIPSTLGGLPGLTGNGWNGLEKAGQYLNYTISLTVAVPTAMNILGPVTTDTLNQFQTEGMIGGWH
jgi:hypothetical protein